MLAIGFATLQSIANGNFAGRIQVKPNHFQRSVWHAVTVSLHSLSSFFFLAFVSALHSISLHTFNSNYNLFGIWRLFSLLSLVFVLHSISALSTKILINTEVFCMQCLNHHFHFSLHCKKMWAVLVTILVQFLFFPFLKHWESVAYTKVHPHRIHFERNDVICFRFWCSFSF